DADVVFQSSDAVHFRIHTKYLECNTGGLPPTEVHSNDSEIVTLAEDSKTLYLLFEFIHPRRHPSLDNEEFSTILAVAEAAERYQVYSAMNYCQQCIRKHIPEHSSAIVAYAATHNYPYVLDGAATQALKIPLEEMIKMLPVNLVVPWVCLLSSYPYWL
ncbi:uncharacterized protein STEHIDRAFT_67132, partial [Stereum hirsutum FP-91666 SS1]|uniref:uncharacterized protein n=1 Tax=Stereum hirsutum (strain FP-91666) TaxID=721885 RepID=UPI0004449BE1